MKISLKGKDNVYEQIVNEYKRFIELGVIKKDDKMPSCRTLGKELGINPNTVVRAYNVLEQEGYIMALPKKGAFVIYSKDTNDNKYNNERKSYLSSIKDKINYEDILVIYDDLDLETGKIRIRPNGSSGGHKGIQSIINNLGTKEVKRVRIGIDKVSSNNTVDYVIGNFSKQEREIIDIAVEKGLDILEDFIRLPFEQVMSRYN